MLCNKHTTIIYKYLCVFVVSADAVHRQNFKFQEATLHQMRGGKGRGGEGRLEEGRGGRGGGGEC